MPSTSILMKGSLDLLHQEFSTSRLFEMIAARKAIIDEFFKTMPRTKLGDVKCLQQEGSHYRAFRFYCGNEAWQGFNPDCEGIFSWNPAHTKLKETGIPLPGYSSGYVKRDGTTYVYGLVRSKWVLVTIDFKAELGYKDRGGERAEKVSIEDTTAENIAETIGIEPKEIYRFLSSIFHPFNKRREELASESRRVSMMMSAEDYILFGQSLAP